MTFNCATNVNGNAKTEKSLDRTFPSARHFHPLRSFSPQPLVHRVFIHPKATVLRDGFFSRYSRSFLQSVSASNRTKDSFLVVYLACP